MNRLSDYFKKLDNNNKISQAFLIGNTTLDEIKEELSIIISDYFFYNNISNIDNNPDIYVIRPENDNISKEKIKNVINEITRTSQFNNIKIYIIDESEKLNDFSCNALLKTLEEPEKNIYAFLITKNLDSIKTTIASRCQKIFLNQYQNKLEIDEKYKLIGVLLIENIEDNNYSIIYKQPQIYNDIQTRDDLKEVLKYLLNKYYESIHCVVENVKAQNTNNIIINNNSLEELSKKIIILSKNIERIDAYPNKNLSIDKLIVEMWRCKNEISRN